MLFNGNFTTRTGRRKHLVKIMSVKKTPFTFFWRHM